MIQIAQDVWHVPAASLKVGGGVRIPLASTVIRLPDRSLAVYSPGKFDDAQYAAIEAEGEVAHIIAPNLLHHLYAGKAAERWPRAQLHGTPGLAAKRADLKFADEIGAPIGDVLEFEIVGGAPKINEAVMFHRPSGTLVCADFLFNVTQPANWQTRFALAVTGSGGKTLKQSRVWSFAIKDRAATRKSIERILAWPIKLVSPVHGEPVGVERARIATLLERAYKGNVPLPP